MKIETIEQAIAAIESAGYQVYYSPPKPLTSNDLGFLGMTEPTWSIFRLRPCFDHPGTHKEKELIEFARKCQLKAFW